MTWISFLEGGVHLFQECTSAHQMLNAAPGLIIYQLIFLKDVGRAGGIYHDLLSLSSPLPWACWIVPLSWPVSLFFFYFFIFFCYEEARFAPARKIFFFLKWEEEDRTARPLLYSICLYLLALFASLCSSVAFPRLHLRFGLFRPAPALSKTTIDAWLSGCQCLPVHALVQRRACLCVLDNYCVWMFILLLCTCGCEGQFPKAVAGAPPVDTHSHVCACSDMDRWPLDELYLLADMLVWKRLLLSFLISFSEYQGL